MTRRKALARLPYIAEAAREVGDPEFANYASFLLGYHLALAGDPLPVAERRMREMADAVARSGHSYPEAQECHAVLRWLIEPDPRSRDQTYESCNVRLSRSQSAERYARTLWMLALCVHGRHDLALRQSDALGDRLFRVMAVHVADHILYRGLACAALASSARGPARRRLLKDLGRCLRRQHHWSRSGPDFVHMRLLLEAEAAWLRRDSAGSRALFERAAQRALEQEFVHHAALAQERLAYLLTELRRESESLTALGQAVTLYRSWGAETKAASLEASLRSNRLGA